MVQSLAQNDRNKKMGDALANPAMAPYHPLHFVMLVSFAYPSSQTQDVKSMAWEQITLACSSAVPYVASSKIVHSIGCSSKSSALKRGSCKTIIVGKRVLEGLCIR